MGGFNPFKAAKKALKKAVKLFSKVISGVVSAVTSPFGMNIDVPDYDIGTDQSQAIQGVLLNKDSAISHIPIVYGERQVGGTRVFVSTNGTDNKYLYVAFVMSEGQINAFTKLFIDDNEVTLNSYAHGTQATPTGGDYASKLVVQFFDGRDTQTGSSLLQEAPSWTSDHRLSGLAYLALRFEWKGFNTSDDPNNNPYGGNVPAIRAQIQGKKIFDLVSGYTPAYQGNISATSGSGTRTNTTTTANITGVTNPPTANYSSTITFATTSSGAVFKSTATATVSSRSNAAANEFQAVQVRQILTNTDTSAVISDITNGPVSTSDLSQVTAIISQDYACPTANYTLETQVALTGNGPQVGIPTGTFKIFGQMGISPVAAHSTAYESDTLTFSKNPVNVLVDYMRNPRFGKGLSNDAFNWDSLRSAAKLCDQTVTYANSTTSKAFTCDAVIDTANSLMVNCKILLAGFRGIMPYQGGRYHIKVEHGGDESDITATPTLPTTVFTVTNDDIVGGLSLEGESKQHKCNRCVVTYVDPEADYQPNDVTYPEEGSTDDTTFLAADNSIRLEKRVTLPTIADRKIAEQYARVFVKRSRTQKFIAFNTTLATTNTTVGDLVRVISTNIGLDGIFRIMDIKINAQGDIELSGMEHQSSTYGIGASGTDYIRPTLSLPDPLQVGAPTGLTLASGTVHNLTDVNNNVTYRIRCDWTASTDPFVNDYVVQYKKSSDPDYITFTQTSETYTYISPVALGESYNVRVLARNELNRRSAYIRVDNHKVVSTYTPASGSSSSQSGGSITTISQSWSP